MASSTDIASLLPTPQDRTLAAEADRALSATAAGADGLAVRLADGTTVRLPPGAARVLKQALAAMAQGHAVAVMPVQAELTSQEAADLLGVSRPFLVSLLTRNALPYRKVGTHRRVRLDDLLRYKRTAEAEREATMQALAAEAQTLGLGY